MVSTRRKFLGLFCLILSLFYVALISAAAVAPWIIGQDGYIYGPSWQSTGQIAIDFAISGNTVWFIDSNNKLWSGEISNNQITNTIQEDIAPLASRVLIDSKGQPWVIGVSSAPYIWGKNPNWRNYGEGAVEFAMVDNNFYFITSGLWGWVNKIDTSNYLGQSIANSVIAKQIALDGNGNPWIINLNNQIYCGVSGVWYGTGRVASNLAISGNNICFIDLSGHLYQGQISINTQVTPTQVTITATQISGAPPAKKAVFGPAITIQATNQAAFATDLNNATTPAQLTTLINTGASATTKVVYNTVNYLVDYPSTTNSIFTKINSFFNADGTSNQTGSSLNDLQTLLQNTNLKQFLSVTEQSSVAIWLTGVNTMLNKVQTRADFATDLNNATTTDLWNKLISTGKSATTGVVYSSAIAYLADMASGGQVYSKLTATFFSGNVPKATDVTTLTTLRSLLSNGVSPYTTINPNLSQFLFSADQATVSTVLLPAVNTALTKAQSRGFSVVFIDTTIQNAITAALNNPTIAAKVVALNAIATQYGSATVSSATQTAFATAIMNLGGSYIYTNFKALNTLYSQIYNKVKAKQKLTAADKTHIKTAIIPYINRVGGNPANFQTLLTDSLKTKLLTGPANTPGTNMFFVNTVLIPAVKILIYLSSIK